MTVSITSTPANGEYYVDGEAITTRISGVPQITSSSPNVFSASRMALDIGGVTRQASVTTILNPPNYPSGDVDFSYTVVAADYDADGVSIPQNSISGTGWRTGAGANVVDRDHAALGAQSAHRVIGVAARISSTSPAALNEANLNAATLAVALDGVTFESGVTTASFELVTTITGVTNRQRVERVQRRHDGDPDPGVDRRHIGRRRSGGEGAGRRPFGKLGPDHGDGGRGAGSGGGSRASTGALSVAVEEGAMGSWDVVLSADPGAGCTGGVTIGVTSGDTAAVTVSPATLTFTTANWDTAQTVTATGVEDGDLADETATISHMVTATGCAAAYPTGLSIASVRVSVEDNDTALFSIDSPRVVEGGAGDTPTLISR